MKLKTLLLTVLLSTSLIGITYADARNFSIKIHNTEIKVKAPDGFYESSYVDPFALEIFSKLMPDDITTHTMLIPKDGTRDRYMALATVTSFDKFKLSQKMFNKEIRGTIKKQQFTLMNNIRGEMDDLFVEKSKSISGDYDVDMNIKMNEVVPLGVFLDDKYSIGFASIFNIEVSIEGSSDSSSVVNATVMANVKNKLIFIYVYSGYNSMKDIIWVKAKANEFVSLLLENNKSKL